MELRSVNYKIKALTPIWTGNVYRRETRSKTRAYWVLYAGGLKLL